MTFTLMRGDCLSVLRTLRDESVHCVATSPPYWGLRSYLQDGDPLKASEIGLEKDLATHITTLVEVFREVRRVLRKDGVCYVNYGDAYATGTAGARKPTQTGKHGYWENPAITHRINGKSEGLKPKDRMMLPARLAIALCDDGWWLRDEIIYAKANPMPTSVHDRTTPAHEMVYMFSKSARYFYDSFAIREPASSNTHARTGKIKAPDGWDTGEGAHGTIHRNGREKGKTVNLPGVTPKSAPEDDRFVRAKESWHASTTSVLATRNKRSVWSIATEPSTDDSKHYAAYPTALVLPMIKAGTSEKGCCARCGAPWRRETSTSYNNPGNRTTNGPRSLDRRHETAGFAQRLEKQTTTTGWSPGCACDAPMVPCTVLDPFVGSGTTALVADRLGRHCIGIELSDEYADYAERRVREDRGQLFDDRTAINAITPDGQAGLFDQAAE